MRVAEHSPDPTRRHTPFPPPLKKPTRAQLERLERVLAEVRAPARPLPPLPTPEAFAKFADTPVAYERSLVPRVVELKAVVQKRRREATTVRDFVALIVETTNAHRDRRRAATGLNLGNPPMSLEDFAVVIAHECRLRVMRHEGLSPKHPSASEIDGNTLRIVHFGISGHGYVPLLRCTTRLVMRACGLPQRGAAADAFTKLLVQTTKPMGCGFPNYEEACRD